MLSYLNAGRCIGNEPPTQSSTLLSNNRVPLYYHLYNESPYFHGNLGFARLFGICDMEMYSMPCVLSSG